MKSCIFSDKRPDYESNSYDLQLQQQQEQPNELAVYEPTPELQRHSHKQAIQMKSTTTTADIQSMKEQLFELNKQRAIRVNLMQQFKQTTTTNTADTSDDSCSFNFPFLEASLSTSIQNKISSTHINKTFPIISGSTFTLVENQIESEFKEEDEEEYLTRAFSNKTYQSPSVENQTSVQTYPTQLYVCIVPYEAKCQGDITLRYAERVQLIHVNDNNGLSLVQNVSTKECGYIPTNCIMLMASFLNQL